MFFQIIYKTWKNIEYMNFVKRNIAPWLTASLLDTKVKIMCAWAQARATPKIGDSRRVAMTAHFQVRTFEVRTLFQVVYCRAGLIIILLPQSVVWENLLKLKIKDTLFAGGPENYMDRSTCLALAKMCAEKSRISSFDAVTRHETSINALRSSSCLSSYKWHHSLNNISNF